MTRSYKEPNGIAIYNLKGKQISFVKDVDGAHRFTKIQKPRISDCLYNRSNYAGKYQFRYQFGTRVINKLIPIK